MVLEISLFYFNKKQKFFSFEKMIDSVCSVRKKSLYGLENIFISVFLLEHMLEIVFARFSVRG